MFRKKTFFVALLLLLAVPTAALATESDINYTADTNVTVTVSDQSVTFIIESGSRASTAVVNAGNLTVTVGTGGDSFTVKDTTAGRRMLFNVGGSLQGTCSTSQSSHTLTPGATTTYVIIPSIDSTCANSAPGGGGSPSPSPSGGGSPPPPPPAPPASPPASPPATPPATPPSPPPSPSAAPSGAHSNGTLILDNGTIFLVVNGKKRGFRNPEEYFSHGYKFSQAVAANDTDRALPDEAQAVAKALDGTLVLDKTDNRTIYMIADGKKRGFTSAEVFQGLGYKFSQAIPVDLSDYAAADPIATAEAAHPDGALVLDKSDGRTVWWVLGGTRKGFQSAEVFYTYGFAFDKIVSANDADMALTVGDLVKFRDGTLVRDGEYYYLISDGTKKRFDSVDAMATLGYKQENAIVADLSSYTAGSAMQ